MLVINRQSGIEILCRIIVESGMYHGDYKEFVDKHYRGEFEKDIFKYSQVAWVFDIPTTHLTPDVSVIDKHKSSSYTGTK